MFVSLKSVRERDFLPIERKCFIVNAALVGTVGLPDWSFSHEV